MFQETLLALCFSKSPLFWFGYSLSLASAINFFLELLGYCLLRSCMVFTVSRHLLMCFHSVLVSASFVNGFGLSPSFLTTLFLSLFPSLSLSLSLPGIQGPLDKKSNMCYSYLSVPCLSELYTCSIWNGCHWIAGIYMVIAW